VTEPDSPSLTFTKLQRPRVGSRLVARPHLLQHLNAARGLTLVLAPAGYGKTTLLSSWLETCPQPAAWLSLDEHDDDLPVFVGYLLSALNAVTKVLTPATLSIVSGATLPPPDLIARTLVNDLSAVEDEVVLILDDYHVIQQQVIHDFMIELVRHLPRALHLVIASRHDPPLPLASLRARGHVTELRAADLRFTLDETGQFLIDAMALSLDERSIAALAARTEGWPAGLRLVALALRQPQAAGSIAADAPRADRYVADYLVAEVLSQLPPPILDCLVKTAILDRLSGPLCEAVIGPTERRFSGQSVLDWLERTDFFLTPVDDGHQWFRCHQLLRQILHDRLLHEHRPAEIAELHRRASVWFADNGFLDEALQHALAADDVSAAVQIVAQHRHELMNQAQWPRLDRWIKLFPRNVVDQHPDLLLADVWIKYLQQRLLEVVPLLDRVEALLPNLPPEAAILLQGEVESRRSALLYWKGDSAGSLTLAQQALDKVPLERWYVRGYVRLFLGGGYLAAGDLNKAYETFYAAGEPDLGSGYRNLLIGGACVVHWIAADLAGMGQAARRVVANSDPLDHAEIVSFARYYLGMYHYQRNELIEAESYLLPLVLQPYLSHAQCFLNSAVQLARIRQLQQRPAEADQIADVMLAYALDTRSEVALFMTRAFQAELALRRGHLPEASQWLEHCGPFRRVPVPFGFVPHLVLAGLLLAQNTPASRRQAQELLADMDDYFGSIHYTVIRIRVLALQAILYRVDGDERQALTALSASIALAAPGRFLRLFVDLGTALRPLLQQLAQRGVAPDYIADILAAYGPGDDSRLVEELVRGESASSAAASALLTSREQDVLRLLARRYTDKEIAVALVISPKTVSSHIDHLSDKLGARGRRAIVEAAREQNLLG
jgi:LuxR family maltose regulon positive regulatory protein